jgi:hypothetical protein
LVGGCLCGEIVKLGRAEENDKGIGKFIKAIPHGKNEEGMTRQIEVKYGGITKNRKG